MSDTETSPDKFGGDISKQTVTHPFMYKKTSLTNERSIESNR